MREHDLAAHRRPLPGGGLRVEGDRREQALDAQPLLGDGESLGEAEGKDDVGDRIARPRAEVGEDHLPQAVGGDPGATVVLPQQVGEGFLHARLFQDAALGQVACELRHVLG